MDTYTNHYEKNHTNLRIELKIKEQTVKEHTKMTERINYSFSKLNSYDDIVTIVKWLRTCLRGIDEKKLEIITCGNKKYCKVIYRKGELVEYMANFNINGEFINICFKLDRIDISSPLKDSSKQEVYKQVIEKGMDEILNLKRIYPITLTEEEEFLGTYFKVFYGKNLNFHKEDIYAEINLLYSILALFQIPFNKERFLPNSLLLQNTIDSLIPLEELEGKESTEKEDKIKIILQKVKEYFGDLLNETENRALKLEELAKKLYVVNSYFTISENQTSLPTLEIVDQRLQYLTQK